MKKFDLEFAVGLFEFENSPGELGFASAGGAHEQDRVGRAGGYMFDTGYEGVEGLVTGFDAGLEEGDIVADLLFEAHGDVIVFGQIQVDDLVVTELALMFAMRGAGLEKFAGKVEGFGE